MSSKAQIWDNNISCCEMNKNGKGLYKNEEIIILGLQYQKPMKATSFLWNCGAVHHWETLKFGIKLHIG